MKTGELHPHETGFPKPSKYRWKISRGLFSKRIQLNRNRRQIDRHSMILCEVGPDTSAHVRDVTRHVFASADAREGAMAFAEKRTPTWTGK